VSDETDEMLEGTYEIRMGHSIEINTPFGKVIREILNMEVGQEITITKTS